MTIQDLRDRNLIVLECISGSKSYELDLPGSDTDIKGVFVCQKRNTAGIMKEGLSLKTIILVTLLPTFYKNQNRTDAIKTVRRKQNLTREFFSKSS
jgi:hypothetical protein